MDTLHSIENLPTEDTENEDLSKEEPLNFRFMARNVSIDWRSVSLIDGVGTVRNFFLKLSMIEALREAILV